MILFFFSFISVYSLVVKGLKESPLKVKVIESFTVLTRPTYKLSRFSIVFFFIAIFKRKKFISLYAVRRFCGPIYLVQTSIC